MQKERLGILLCSFFIILASFAMSQTIPQRPIVVVIPSYNNAEWYEYNLNSVFSQEYENYRVIYIDDCSTDGTYNLVERYIETSGQTDRVVLIKNRKRVGALANHYKAIHACNDDEIIVNLDGDDWFSQKKVLSRVNEIYSNPDVWFMYAQLRVYPTNERGQSKAFTQNVIAKRGYRHVDWSTCALRTFYAGLFKQIKLRDLLYKGVFAIVASDLAYTFPILEMAAGRIAFIDEELYIYNCKTFNNDFKQRAALQVHLEHTIRSRYPYNPVDVLPSCDAGKDAQKVDVVIFLSKNPEQLKRVITSIYHHVSGVGNVHVLSQDDNQDVLKERFTELFPDITWLSYENYGLKSLLITILDDQKSDYLLFMQDDFIVNEAVDLSACVRLMNQTYSRGFFLALGSNITHYKGLLRAKKVPSSVEIDDGIYAWQFKHGEYDWHNPHNLSMTLYRKKDIHQSITNISFDSVDQFSWLWAQSPFDSEDIGLYFYTARTIKI